MYTFFSRLLGCGRRSAVGAASKRGARARTAPAAPCPPFSLLPGTPRPLPAEFQQAREPGDAHAALRPGAGASRAPAQRAPLSSASTRVRRRVRSSFRTGAGGGRSAQDVLPRTPHALSCRHREDGRRYGEFPCHAHCHAWRWRVPTAVAPGPAPHQEERKSPRPAGQGFLVRSANWEDGRPSASSPS